MSIKQFVTCHCNAVCMHKSRVRYASWYKTYISPPKYIFMISLVVKGGWLVGKNVIGSNFPLHKFSANYFSEVWYINLQKVKIIATDDLSVLDHLCVAITYTYSI